MAYLPKHYIKTGLFANPGNFLDRESNQPYSGPYYEIATGQYFTGTGPQDPSTREIIPFGNAEEPGTGYQQVGVAFNLDVKTLRPGESSNSIQNQLDFQVSQPQLIDNYLQAKKYPESYYNTRILPYGVTPTPDENDYSIGEYVRYFCKKTNELLYLELDQIQYTALSQKDPKYFWEQYFTFSLPWSLTGDPQQVFKTNQAIVQRRIQNLKLTNFSKYLREDYLKFYKQS